MLDEPTVKKMAEEISKSIILYSNQKIEKIVFEGKTMSAEDFKKMFEYGDLLDFFVFNPSPQAQELKDLFRIRRPLAPLQPVLAVKKRRVRVHDK